MSQSLFLDLAGYAVLSLIGCYWLTGLARQLSYRIRLLDRPDGGRKAHREPTPLMGGVAIFLSVSAAALLAAWLNPAWLATDQSWDRVFPTLLISAGAICLVGLWDDKRPMRPRTKFAWQVIAAVPWAFAGRVLEPIQVAGISIDLGTASFPFVVLWLVACANVINLVDGLDGLASTICLIVSTTVCALALTTGMHGAAFLAAVVAASLVGFLGHNLPPARIFLGDSGSLTLGFLIGALSLEASTKRATGLILTVPLVLMSIPIFDTAMAILRRKLNGRSIGEGDRAHIHHRLQDRGLSQSRALLVIAFLCTVMAATAFVSAVLRSEWIGLAICGSVLALLIAGGVFGHEETIHFFHYLRGLGRVLAARAGLLKTELSLAQRDRIQRSRVAALWAELCRRTQGLGGDALELQCRDAATDGLLWRRTWAIQTSASMPSSPDQPRPVAETEAEEMTSSHGEDQASEIDPLQKKPVGWEVAYTVHRAEDLRVVLIAHGTLSRTPPAAALAELLHLSQKLYESWKREDPSDEFPRGPESNPQITNPPAFLRPLPTRSPEPEGPEPEPHRRAA